MSGKTNGGVFNPKNLNLFTYTYNNPVNLVDPDKNVDVYLNDVLVEEYENCNELPDSSSVCGA
jgi:hypothetical protein